MLLSGQNMAAACIQIPKTSKFSFLPISLMPIYCEILFSYSSERRMKRLLELCLFCTCGKFEGSAISIRNPQCTVCIQ